MLLADLDRTHRMHLVLWRSRCVIFQPGQRTSRLTPLGIGPRGCHARLFLAWKQV